MLSMGITLTPNDFKEVASRPNATLMQFALCYGMMPILALTLGNAFKLEKSLVAGLVLVGCINGGQASNLCTYVRKISVVVVVVGYCCLFIRIGRMTEIFTHLQLSTFRSREAMWRCPCS
jgi:BASS family bile acid:Na+ symporter